MAKKTDRKIKSLKICITGSHGTGKSTLARALARKLKFNYIPDVVRMKGGAFDKDFPVDEGTLPETQFWILSKQLELERNTLPPWIADKSLYDNIIYGQATFKDKRVIELLKEIVFRNAKYDLLIYLPPIFLLKSGGREILPSGEVRWKTRSPDVKFQKIVDQSFKKFFKERKIKYLEIKESNFEKRLKIAMEAIKNAK